VHESSGPVQGWGPQALACPPPWRARTRRRRGSAWRDQGPARLRWRQGAGWAWRALVV